MTVYSQDGRITPVVVGITQGQIQDVATHILPQFLDGIDDHFRQRTAIGFVTNRRAEFRNIRHSIKAMHAQTLNTTIGELAVKTRHKQHVVFINQGFSRTNAKLSGNFQIGCFITQNLLITFVCATAPWEFNQPGFFDLFVGQRSFGMKHAGRVMCEQGSGAIVSLASTAGVMGALGPHVYTMAKHGVVGLTKSAASEFSAFGVRVNAVAPAGTVTPMTAALVGNDVELITRNIAEGSPLGIPCMPEDIANSILFLLSEDARQISGQTLVIDGGLTTGGQASPFYSQDAEVLLHAGQRIVD